MSTIRRPAVVAAIAGAAATLALAGCGGTSAGPGQGRLSHVGLSPLVKRIEALDSAYDHAHPGLVNCEATTYALLTESWTDMQHGGQGIPSEAVTAEYGWKSAVAGAYLPFYDALASYASAHGTRGYGAVRTVTGGPSGGYVLRHGKLRYVAGQLARTCLAALSTAHHPQAPVSPPAGSGYAGALAAWKQSADAAAYDLSRYLLKAADDLRATGNSNYAAATRELKNLASLPETGDTPAQQAQADVTALDRFFGTPGLNG